MLGPKKLRYSSSQLVPRDGEDNHVHLVVRYPTRYPPTVNWSAVVGNSLKLLRFRVLNRLGSFYWGRHSCTLWSSGFFVCSVGVT
ncbi:MAG: hypothetical protein DMG39_04845 [Acidobacteria bacterium]|nr:MAG: hypothetical protein DMG39_04845 [Acidobacteriota bacterium]